MLGKYYTNLFTFPAPDLNLNHTFNIYISVDSLLKLSLWHFNKEEGEVGDGQHFLINKCISIP